MKTILISPYSKKVETFSRNAKNYPYFEDLVKRLRSFNCFHTVQVGINGEDPIGCDEMLFNLSLDDLAKKIIKCHSWISVDNFFHHLSWVHGKVGNVIFGASDPLIYGHLENNNILKNRKYLAQNQFDIWEEIRYNEHAYEKADMVLAKLDFIRSL